MSFEEWNQRWEQDRIGFNEGQPNAFLVKHAAKFGKPRRILVPLAGKAADMHWLSGKGFDVVGIEFVQKAIDAFFKETAKVATPHRLGAHDAFYADGVTLVHADIFDVTPETIGHFDAVYDRAALVALDPSQRLAYAKRCRELLTPGGGILLIGFSYDQTQREGPPWSVDQAAVHETYAGMTIEVLETRGVPESKITGLEETVYWIS